MYIERINEEWIAVEFWYIWLGHESIGNYGSAQAAFRKVLGYDSATGTYAKEVILLEHAGCTLTEWVESYFTKSV